jgi:hypothetical protein
MPKMPKMPKIPGVSGGGGATTLPPLEYRRLAALGVGILLVIVVLVFLAKSCSGSSAKGSNEAYVGTLTTTVLKPSDAIASRFHKTIDLPRASLGLVQRRIDLQLAQMRTVKSHALALKPTKQLAPYQAGLLQSLQFRIDGLQCLSERLKAAWAVKRALASGQQLYTCTGQLLTSDYVYSELFANGANAALKQVGATGVPTSQFLQTSDLAWVTPIGIGQALQRLHPGKVHGVHGTEVLAVVASPAGTTLQSGNLNQVNGNQQLTFVVSVKNSGNFTEVGVDVVLTLKRAGSSAKPITKTVRITSIAKGATAQVHFPGLFASTQTAPSYSVPYKLTVRSQKVPGEHNLTNNTLSYNVEFNVS